jgi:TRAP-type C4-dicarboxylate transport system permease small subunit
MTLMVTITAIMRKVGLSTAFAHEISGYCLVAIIFLGTAYTLRVGRHIEISAVTGRLKPRVRQWLRVATSTFGLAFIGWLFWFTLRFALRSYDFGSVSMTELRVLLWPLQMLLPVGLVLLGLAVILEIVKTIRGQPQEAVSQGIT